MWRARGRKGGSLRQRLVEGKGGGQLCAGGGEARTDDLSRKEQGAWAVRGRKRRGTNGAPMTAPTRQTGSWSPGEQYGLYRRCHGEHGKIGVT